MENNSFYKIQELVKMVIPGMYFIGLLFLFIFFSTDSNAVKDNLVALVKDFATFVVYMIPVIGFIAGYFIYTLMSLIEMIVYGAVGLPHPAWYILNSKFGKYKVAKIEKIVEGRTISPAEAKIMVREARDLVGKSKVEDAHNESLLARSIFGAQLLLSIYLPFAKLSYGAGTCLAMWGVSALFLFAWFHRNLLYYKSIISKLVKDDEALTKFKTSMSS